MGTVTDPGVRESPRRMGVLTNVARLRNSMRQTKALDAPRMVRDCDIHRDTLSDQDAPPLCDQRPRPALHSNLSCDDIPVFAPVVPESDLDNVDAGSLLFQLQVDRPH